MQCLHRVVTGSHVALSVLCSVYRVVMGNHVALSVLCSVYTELLWEIMLHWVYYAVFTQSCYGKSCCTECTMQCLHRVVMGNHVALSVLCSVYTELLWEIMLHWVYYAVFTQSCYGKSCCTECTMQCLHRVVMGNHVALSVLCSVYTELLWEIMLHWVYYAVFTQSCYGKSCCTECTMQCLHRVVMWNHVALSVLCSVYTELLWEIMLHKHICFVKIAEPLWNDPWPKRVE